MYAVVLWHGYTWLSWITFVFHPQAGSISSSLPAADRRVQESGCRGWKAAPRAVRFREPATWGNAPEGMCLRDTDKASFIHANSKGLVYKPLKTLGDTITSLHHVPALRLDHTACSSSLGVMLARQAACSLMMSTCHLAELCLGTEYTALTAGNSSVLSSGKKTAACPTSVHLSSSSHNENKPFFLLSFLCF